VRVEERLRPAAEAHAYPCTASPQDEGCFRRAHRGEGGVEALAVQRLKQCPPGRLLGDVAIGQGACDVRAEVEHPLALGMGEYPHLDAGPPGADVRQKGQGEDDVPHPAFE